MAGESIKWGKGDRDGSKPYYSHIQSRRKAAELFDSSFEPDSAWPDFEVVVVVDGSTDGTREMLSSLETPFALRVIKQPNSGQPAALNRGAAESMGRLSIFLDDDIIVVPEFVAEHLRLHHRRDRVVGIGQLTLTLSTGADWFARGFAQTWSQHYEEFHRGKRQPDWDDCYGGNMSISRTTFMPWVGT